ncbi:uncharacterized protein LOC109824465 isoform X2 [Asparagus officinalis]|nr:uncharacterized protein LOC109824465 isoform X2 [Asparagus officinalis]
MNLRELESELYLEHPGGSEDITSINIGRATLRAVGCQTRGRHAWAHGSQPQVALNPRIVKLGAANEAIKPQNCEARATNEAIELHNFEAGATNSRIVKQKQQMR